ncbi:MAG TPA: TRAFs-binding domain-containing protein [Myxococcaceae bacterium]|nr:TRAFs-binding domain-containing protein [Myxococcaceae bacterium]
MRNSLCFVLMPLGRRLDAGGRSVDFDAVYQRVVRTAIERAGLEPIRAEEAVAGGVIHEDVFERLALCDSVVTDLTTADAGILYELGVRHAIRPWRTVPIAAEGSRLPFDVQSLRPLTYRLDAAGTPAAADGDGEQLATRLRAAREDPAGPGDDSPVFQLLGYLRRTEAPPEKASLFQKQARSSAEAKRALALARRQGSVVAVQGALRELGQQGEIDTGVLIDAMLSYRALRAWKVMVEFIGALPPELQATPMVQEQRAFALSRDGRGDEAERVLDGLLQAHGPSPETLARLGGVFQDRWETAEAAGRKDEARALSRKAAAAYLRGFEVDFRDAAPGIHALTWMEVSDPLDPRREELLPVVRYAVRRRMASRTPDYRDHAMLLELAVLARDPAGLKDALGAALAAMREPRELETTARNLSIISRARADRGQPFPPADEAERALHLRS